MFHGPYSAWIPNNYLLQDNTSAKINSLIGLCLDGVSMTLKRILPNTYSSHGVSVHALLITLSLLEVLGVLKFFSESRIGCAKVIWCFFLVVFVSTSVYFCRNALLPKLCLTKSLAFGIFSLPLLACVFPSSFASFPVFSPCKFYYVPASLEENGHSEMLVSSMSREFLSST